AIEGNGYALVRLLGDDLADFCMGDDLGHAEGGVDTVGLQRRGRHLPRRGVGVRSDAAERADAEGAEKRRTDDQAAGDTGYTGGEQPSALVGFGAVKGIVMVGIEFGYMDGVTGVVIPESVMLPQAPPRIPEQGCSSPRFNPPHDHPFRRPPNGGVKSPVARANDAPRRTSSQHLMPAK